MARLLKQQIPFTTSNVTDVHCAETTCAATELTVAAVSPSIHEIEPVSAPRLTLRLTAVSVSRSLLLIHTSSVES